MTAEQHVQTFQAFLQRPLQSTCDWVCGCWLTDPSSDEYQTALKRDRQSWLLEEPCLCPDLVVTPYDMSMQGSYRLPAQDWDHRCEDAAVRRLRGASADLAPHGRRASRRRPAPDQLVLAERVATELTGLRDLASFRVRACCMAGYLSICWASVFCLRQPALILPDRALLAHASLLGRLAEAEAAGVDATALRRSEPAPMQRLDCLHGGFSPR